MAKRTPYPSQLTFDFDAPIVAVVEVLPSGPTFGMPVHFFDHGDEIFVTFGGELLGFVEPRQYRTLSNLLWRIDVEIEAVLGEDIEGGNQIIVHWRTDESSHRSLVRCVRPAGDTRLAA